MKLIHVESECTHEPDPYQNLAIGIIRQAAEDYRRQGKKLQRNGSTIEKNHIADEMKKISRFFLSSWYSTLSGIENGADLLGSLDQEVFGDD